MTTDMTGRGSGAVADHSRSMVDDFAATVQPWMRSMRRLAVVMAPGVDPEDIVQEALTRAWRKRHTYRPNRGSVCSWLLAVTADQARRLRRGRREYVLIDEDQAVSSDTAALGANVDLRRAVDALPRRQRQAVVLFYFVDLSLLDTAALMGCAPGTVKSTLADARTRLATELGGDPRA